MGKVTVVCSGKGGVGKSTTVVGLACSFAEQGERVLIIDCDAGLRALDKLTGIEEYLAYDLSDIIKGNCAPINAIYQASFQENLFVIPAPAVIENIVSPTAMKKLILVLSKYYEQIIIDSPAGIGSGFQTAICSADRAIVVCNPDPVCVQSSAVVSDLLLKVNIDEQRLIINRLNTTFFEQIEILEDLDKVIDRAGIRLLGVVPEDYVTAAAFLAGKKPEPNAKAMSAFRRISARLEGVNGPLIL